jgi:hypothetical protein
VNEPTIERASDANLSPTAGSTEQANAVELLLARVPLPAEKGSCSTQWINCEERKVDPHTIF